MVNHVELGMNVKTTFAKMASALVSLWNSLKNLPCLQNEIKFKLEIKVIRIHSSLKDNVVIV